jgi:adhesin transport system outer membrane protein
VPPYSKVTDETLIQRYLSFSPLIAQRKAEVEAALANVEVRRASIFPTVSLRVERVQSALQGGVVLDDKRIGLTFQYVPDAGLASLSLIKEAESKVDATRAEVQKVEVDLKMAAKTTYADFKTASAQISALQEQAQTVAKTANSFLRQFESGRKTWIDVLNIHRELIEVQTALSRAKLLLEQSQIRLMANSGELQPWLGALPL